MQRQPKKSRRAQASLEFLSTYSWAILVAMILIATLWQFDMFSPKRIAPNLCILPPGLACEDWSVQSTAAPGGNGRVSLVIRNDFGSIVILEQVSVESCALDVAIPLAQQSLGHAESSDPIEIDCATPLESGSRFFAQITLQYTSLASGLTKKQGGEIASFVQ